MGTFHIKCKIENPVERKKSTLVSKALVDTGSEYTWIPERILNKISIKREKKDLQFIMANGLIVTRSVGFAIIRIGKSFTIDEVVFGQEGDLLLLGARTLEGMALTVDPRRKKLVASGPLPAATIIALGNRGSKNFIGLMHAQLTLANPTKSELSTFETEVLVDTGALHLCVPEHIAIQLELRELEKDRGHKSHSIASIKKGPRRG